MPSRRRVRLAGVLLFALVLLVALPFVGRWEQRRHADAENPRMAAMYREATAGGLISGRLDAYRLAGAFDCLLYAAPGGQPPGPDALELCFDPQGRLVQTIDRRGSQPRIASLQEQPSLATLRVPVRRLIAALAKVGAFADPRLKGVSRDLATLPVGFADTGASSNP